MRVLVDINIVLDFLLQREPFFQDAELLFQAIDQKEVDGYVTATALTDIYYIARKYTRNAEQARKAISETLTAMAICPVDRAVLELAFNSGLDDFEDAVQIFSAVAQGLEAVVTRDAQDFLRSPIPVLSVEEVLQQVRQQNGG